MPFYQDLSDCYDEIFALSEEETSFLVPRVKGRKSLLDIGCATGAKTALCAQHVTTVTGIDTDKEMIARAKEKNSAINIHYQQSGMADIIEKFACNSFDSALCVGNTLVHLPNEEAIKKTIEDVYAVLQHSGIFILQILNYNRILGKDIRSLPRIESSDYVFDRQYSFEKGIMYFTTCLEYKPTGKLHQNTIPLLPLQKNTLHQLIQGAGFTQIQYFGDYKENVYTEDSFLTIAVCYK